MFPDGEGHDGAKAHEQQLSVAARIAEGRRAKAQRKVKAEADDAHKVAGLATRAKLSWTGHPVFAEVGLFVPPLKPPMAGKSAQAVLMQQQALVRHTHDAVMKVLLRRCGAATVRSLRNGWLPPRPQTFLCCTRVLTLSRFLSSFPDCVS